MNYWVYENWPVSKSGQARVHREDCKFCNFGRGVRGKPSTRNGAWYGPFDSVDETQAVRLKKPRVVEKCSVCLKNHH